MIAGCVMANYVEACLVTDQDTDVWFNTHADKGFTVVHLGDRYGSEVRIHLRPGEIDRLRTVLDQARTSLATPALNSPVPVAARP